MRRESEIISELETLCNLRKVVHGEFKVSEFLAENWVELAAWFGMPQCTMKAAIEAGGMYAGDDRAIARKIRAAIDDRRAAIGAERLAQANQDAAETALELKRTALLVVGKRVELNPPMLFRLLDNPEADTFVICDGEHRIPLAKSLLRDIKSAVAKLDGVTCYIDSFGIHFRWRNGRGGLNLNPCMVGKRLMEVPMSYIPKGYAPEKNGPFVETKQGKQDAWTAEVNKAQEQKATPAPQSEHAAPTPIASAHPIAAAPVESTAAKQVYAVACRLTNIRDFRAMIQRTGAFIVDTRTVIPTARNSYRAPRMAKEFGERYLSLPNASAAQFRDLLETHPTLILLTWQDTRRKGCYARGITLALRSRADIYHVIAGQALHDNETSSSTAA